MAARIQDIFADHFAAYRCSHRLTWRETWAGYNITTCHTAKQGVHILRCPHDHVELVRFNSCKHRCCPQCGWVETERWVRTQQARALPCAYHQVVFTVPHELIPLWLYNRSLFVNLLFNAAWGALRHLLSQDRWLGALPGVIGAFQSWGETLNLHPHLHFIVTAGGLDPQGRWRACRNGFLLPARVLQEVFRGKFRAELNEHLEAEPRLTLPPDWRAAKTRGLLNRLGQVKWNVRIEPAYAHPDGILIYLARYLRQGPIAESRIAAYDQHDVMVAYKRPEEHRGRYFTVSAPEFIRRVLVHAPPKGLRMVRHLGLFHHQRRQQLQMARDQLPPDASTHDTRDTRGEVRREAPATFPALCCPRCGARLRLVLADYPIRAPPSHPEIAA